MSKNQDSADSIFKINCPVCNSNKFFTNKKIVDIPNYGKILLLTLICNECNYKVNDVYNLESKKPLRYIFNCRKIGDLNVRVIKSGNSTIHIPEIGVDIEPGPSSEGYITNVEGILRRIELILELLKKNNKSPEETEKIIEKQEVMNAIFEGKYPFTLIIEDPTGNSCIISDENLIIKDLSKKEIDELEKGYLFSLELDDLNDK